MWFGERGELRALWRLALFALLFLLALTLLAALAGPGGGVVRGAFPVLGAALAAGWAMLGMEGRGPGALGFHLRRSAPCEGALGLAAGAALAAACLLLILLLGGLRLAREPGTPAALVGAAARALWTFAAPAAAEEALFRGYPFQTLVRAIGGGPATALGGAAFGALHVENPHATWIGIVNTGLAGVLLSLVYLRTSSLWAATGVHLGWNWGIGFLADLPVSGLDLVDTPYIAVTPVGRDWLAGGVFGPEAGAAATLVLAAASGVAWRVRWPRPLGTSETEPKGKPPEPPGSGPE